MKKNGPCTHDAIRNAILDTLDERGLMPIEQARALIAPIRTFACGKDRIIGGINVTDGDRLWAALLSLENAEEFLREARRITWKGRPRGMDNRALAERYGAELIPWIKDHVDATGKLTNHPWCIIPCILAIDSPLALDLLLGVASIKGYDLDEPKDPRKQAHDLILRWVCAHHKTAYRHLRRLANRGDEKAGTLLDTIQAE